MEDVMNNNDLRRLIWSYLRKEAKVSCHLCKDVCIWDIKRRKQYYYMSMLIEGELKNVYYCKECWLNNIPLNPYFNCIVT
tara:strand:- start:2588 stop:2827 length:240 start_codon:yes stop_codon:yes gene_type:complete